MTEDNRRQKADLAAQQEENAEMEQVLDRHTWRVVELERDLAAAESASRLTELSRE